MSEYEEILRMMQSMAQVMELSPHVFQDFLARSLRTHFLRTLNSKYESQATGQTFNFSGEDGYSDWCADGRNVFIAECKFWSGKRRILRR